MRNAIVLMSLVGLAATPPLVAQQKSNTNIVIVTGDTTIHINRGEKNSCEVKVDGRALAKAAADRVCERQLASVSFNSRGGELMAVQLERLRNTLRDSELISRESLQKLSDRERELVADLKLRSLALADRGRGLALLSPDAANDAVLREYKGLLSSAFVGRPIIGVTVDAQPRETDRYGAYVVAVTPNGPADKAGVRATDIITKVDGKSITGRTERAVDGGASQVWIRLTEVVGKLKPGTEVALEYRRDGRNHTTRVTPKSDSRFVVRAPGDDGADGFTFSFGTGEDAPFFAVRPPSAPNAPEAPKSRLWVGEPSAVATPDGLAFGEFRVEGVPLAQSGVFSSFGRSFGNIQLAPINPKLGSYFGTSTGVLVVDVPEKGNAMGLEAGDVITAIDGRSVESPTDLARILRSYRKDEAFTIKVMRNKQSRSITSTLP